MADVLLSQTDLGISNDPEAVLNNMYTLAADFSRLGTTQLSVVIPQVEKFTNAGRVGNSQQWGTVVNHEYVSHPQITISDRLNLGLASKLFLRAIAPQTLSTAGSGSLFNHTWTMCAAGVYPSQLRSSTVGFKTGGFDFLLGGMVVNQFTIAMQDNMPPMFSANLIGTGKFSQMSVQSPALVIPAYSAQSYVGVQAGAAFTFQMNDGTAFDLASLGRLKAFQFQINNNVRLSDRRSSDPINSGGATWGRHVTRMRRGQISIDLAVQVYVEATSAREWAAHLANTLMGTTTITMGRQFGTGADGGSFTLNIRNGAIVNPSITDDGRGRSILSFNLLVLDSTAGTGPLHGVISNTSASGVMASELSL